MKSTGQRTPDSNPKPSSPKWVLASGFDALLSAASTSQPSSCASGLHLQFKGPLMSKDANDEANAH